MFILASRGYYQYMYIGLGIILTAIGAVLKFAITDSVSGVDLSTIGLILLIVGIATILLSAIMMAVSGRSRTVVNHTDANGVQHATTTDSRVTPTVR